MRGYGMTIATMAAALLAMSYYQSQDKPAPAPELGVLPQAKPAEAGRALHANEFVQFTKGGFACIRREDLRTLLQHTQKGEQDQAKAMLAREEHSDAPCALLSAERRYKVISAVYGDARQQVGLLEVAAEGVDTRRGAWALSVGAVPAAAAEPANPAR